MNKEIYLEELEKNLQSLGRKERLSAMEYWTEYIEDAGAENEQETLARLGSPRALAAKILSESGGPREETPGKRIALWTLVILGSPLWLSLLAAGLLLAVAVAMTVICALFSLLLLLGCGVLLLAVMMLGGVFCVLCGAAVMLEHAPTAVFFLGAGLMMAAAGTAGMLGYLPVISRPWHFCVRAIGRTGDAFKACVRRIGERGGRR